MPIRFLNGQSNVFAAANPFEVSEYVRANVGSHSLRLPRASDASASLSHRRAGTLDLCRLSYGAQARVLSESLGDIYHAQFILQGYCSYTLANRTLDLPAGHVLVEDDLVAKKPGFGIPPASIGTLLGRRLVRDVAHDDLISEDSLEPVR